MIPLFLLNLTDDHIRDICAGHLLEVFDTSKKGMQRHKFEPQKTHRAARCKQRKNVRYYRIPYLSFDLMEAE